MGILFSLKPNVRGTKSPNLNDARLVLEVAFAQSMGVMCQGENEDVIGAAPTGDGPATSEWSTSLLTTKARLISEVWRYMLVV